MLKQGDILLVHSKFDPIAWIIHYFTKSYWNHVAWAIDAHYLIEMKATNINVCSIRKYLNWKYDVKLIRLKNVTKDEFKEAIKYIKQFKIKRSYFTYLKLLLKLLCSDKNKFICGFTCSSFIARALEEVNYYFIPSNKKWIYLITPEDIANSKSKNITYELKGYR